MHSTSSASSIGHSRAPHRRSLCATAGAPPRSSTLWCRSRGTAREPPQGCGAGRGLRRVSEAWPGSTHVLASRHPPILRLQETKMWRWPKDLKGEWGRGRAWALTSLPTSGRVPLGCPAGPRPDGVPALEGPHPPWLHPDAEAATATGGPAAFPPGLAQACAAAAPAAPAAHSAALLPARQRGPPQLQLNWPVALPALSPASSPSQRGARMLPFTQLFAPGQGQGLKIKSRGLWPAKQMPPLCLGATRVIRDVWLACHDLLGPAVRGRQGLGAWWGRVGQDRGGPVSWSRAPRHGCVPAQPVLVSGSLG